MKEPTSKRIKCNRSVWYQQQNSYVIWLYLYMLVFCPFLPSKTASPRKMGYSFRSMNGMYAWQCLCVYRQYKTFFSFIRCLFRIKWIFFPPFDIYIIPFSAEKKQYTFFSFLFLSERIRFSFHFCLSCFRLSLLFSTLSPIRSLTIILRAWTREIMEMKKKKKTKKKVSR